MEVWWRCNDSFVRKGDISRLVVSAIMSPQSGAYVPTIKVILRNDDTLLFVIDEAKFDSLTDAVKFVTEFTFTLLNLSSNFSGVVDVNSVARQFYSSTTKTEGSKTENPKTESPETKGSSVDVVIPDSVKFEGDEGISIRIVEEKRETLRKGET